MNARQSRTAVSIMLALSILLAGCAAGVKRAEDAEKRRAYFAGGGKLASEVTMSMDKQAQAQLPQNTGFDQQTLLSTVKRFLRTKGLLANTPNPELPTIEIVITDIRVRTSFSAIMFGAMAGDDHIIGDVIARDKSGRELQRFQVSASYALGGVAGGHGTRMGWLYGKFAEAMVNELTGQESGQQ